MNHKTGTSNHSISFIEFVAMMAIMTSLVAFTIDAVLPALSFIGNDLRSTNPNHNQLLISMVFIGLSIGQIISGAISDSFGRKIVVYYGMGLFILGTLLCYISTDMPTILAGRLLQGLGLGGPRIASIAMIRDKYVGDSMARVMSFVMVVFIFIPAIAPAAGQGLLAFGSWRTIFLSFIIFAVVIMLWFHFRQEETLIEAKRHKFSLQSIGQSLKYIASNRITMTYTVASGFITGAFLGYLNSSQQLFQELYGLGEDFPKYFAFLALGLGAASFLNGKMVMRHGMVNMSKWSVALLSIWSVGFALFAYFKQAELTFFMFMLFLFVALFFIGILFGNIKSLSMEPLGNQAGIGAAIISALSTFMAVPYSVVIGQYYDNSPMPLIVGFAFCSVLAMITMAFARKSL